VRGFGNVKYVISHANQDKVENSADVDVADL